MGSISFAFFCMSIYSAVAGLVSEDQWETECGVSRYEDAGKNIYDDDDGRVGYIVNGWEARIHEFPWMAELRYLGNHKCGAVIINSRWVLSAAHCLDEGIEAPDVTVRVGEHDLVNPNPDMIEFAVDFFILHEDYDGTGSGGSDIALVKVSQDIPGGDIPNYENVTSACKPEHDYGGAYGSASGWGDTEQGGENAEILNYVNNPVLDQQECSDCLPDHIKPGMLCWGYCGSNNRSTCNGDSGGPLSIKDENGYFHVVGLTSFNVGGCVSEYPKIFTNVTYFVPWIEEKLVELS